MYSLQRLPLPDSESPTELYGMYFRSSGYVFDAVKKDLRINSGKSVLFDTYFGAFSLSTWCNLASIDNVSVKIKISGRALIRIVWASPDGSVTTLAEEVSEAVPYSSEPLSITIFLDDLKNKYGILYPEITAFEDAIIVSGLEYETSVPPIQPVRLATIMTTFKRESYVKKNIEKISELTQEFPEGLELFVVDNGQTLEKNNPSGQIHFVPNRNYGGSGGFSKGLLEAIDSPTSFSHFLFCDDDIEIEVESIRRLLKLWGYLKENSVLGGAMLSMQDMVRTSKIYEIGARIDPTTGNNSKQNNLPIGSVIYDGLDRRDLISYDLSQEINFFGWWFFSFPRSILDQAGLPLPLFVRIDDMEFGVRISKMGSRFVTLLGVGVWHEDFTKKRLGLVMDFYGLRNKRIITAIHGENNIQYVLSSTLNPLRNILKSLISLRYKKAMMQYLAFDEFLKGPDRLMEVFGTAWDFHALLGKRLALEIVESKNLISLPKTVSKIYKIFCLTTLNGHLLPTIFFSRDQDPVILDFEHTRLFDSFRRQKVIYQDSFTGKGYVCKHDKKIFFSLLLKSIFLCFKGLVVLPFLRKRYRQAFPAMTSEAYWRGVFSSCPLTNQ